MEGVDWNRCWGEVYQIFRKHGPGHVRVGDIVGIYYPRERNWFALSGGRGHLEPCPGHPTKRYGFQDLHRWFRCWGEVYVIYARGKRNGQLIRDRDDVMLYFIHGHSWVSLGRGYVNTEKCPGGNLPPAPDKYDVCWGENFELFLR